MVFPYYTQMLFTTPLSKTLVTGMAVGQQSIGLTLTSMVDSGYTIEPRRIIPFAGSCFRYSEIGWYKTTSGLQGLVVWDSGCNRSSLTFSITATTHTYSQQYYLSGGNDRYAWFVDGNSIGNGLTNFSYTTTVTCGGEVATGVESMGNTRCGSNYKLRKNPNGTYTFILWNGHTDYVDDPPYYNQNDPSDPNNSFYSKGP